MSDQPPSLIATPEGYADWLLELKTRIHDAQQRATLAVNRQLVLLYWQIGRDILCLLYTSPSPRDRTRSRMPSSA